jgi:hypothetical protein
MRRDDYFDSIREALGHNDAPRLARLAWDILDLHYDHTGEEAEDEPQPPPVPAPQGITLSQQRYVVSPALQQWLAGHGITPASAVFVACPYEQWTITGATGITYLVMWNEQDPAKSVVYDLRALAKSGLTVSWQVQVVP